MPGARCKIFTPSSNRVLLVRGIMTKYVIDIVGTCTLKYPSCGRREHYGHTPSYKGLMDFGLFCAAGFHNGWAVSDHSRVFRDGVNAAMKANGGDRYVAVVSLGYRNHTAIKGLLLRHIQGCRPANIQIDKKKPGICRIRAELARFE
jgi:hypothetical protein